MPRSSTHVLAITELQRSGAGALEEAPVRFEWDPGTHTSPEADFEMPLLVRTVREEHAGTDRPVEQVLSVSWQPFELRGKWRDAWAGQGFAMATFRAFSQMVARAPLVRLELDELSITGLITEFTPTYRDAQQIFWRFTFSPHFHEDGTARPRETVIPPATTPIASRVQALEPEFETGRAGLGKISP